MITKFDDFFSKKVRAWSSFFGKVNKFLKNDGSLIGY